MKQLRKLLLPGSRNNSSSSHSPTAEEADSSAGAANNSSRRDVLTSSPHAALEVHSSGNSPNNCPSGSPLSTCSNTSSTATGPPMNLCSLSTVEINRSYPIETYQFSQQQQKWVPSAPQSSSERTPFSGGIDLLDPSDFGAPEELKANHSTQQQRQQQQSHTWSTAPENQKESQLPSFPKQLKIATYNIWFTSWCAEQRFKKTTALIEEHSPHIACFQEATPKFVNVLLSSPFIRENYFSSDDPECHTLFDADYGIFILSKFPGRIRVYRLPSRMGRDCREWQIKFENCDAPLSIASVHLESLSNRKSRQEQLRIISKECLQSKQFSMLMGDFNFDATRNYLDDGLPLENNNLKEILTDYWDSHVELGGTRQHVSPDGQQLEKNTNGYTFDSERNANVKRTERMRYDRIMVRKNPAWKCTDLQLLGDQPFMKIEDGRDVYPSDHFGLVLTMEVNLLD